MICIKQFTYKYSFVNILFGYMKKHILVKLVVQSAV